MPQSFRQQIVVLTATATAFAMLVLAVVLQLVLHAQTQREVDRVLADRADAVVASLGDPDRDGDGLSVPDERLGAGVAVYLADGTLVAGNAPASLARAYERLSTGTEVEQRDVDELTRVRSSPFTTSDGVSGVVIVAENLAPYEEAEATALLVSLVTGLLTIAVVAAVAAWATKRALRPVGDLARTADDWSQHDLGRRFDLGPPTNEISTLAGTLDHLLDRVSHAIRSEQRLTSELAHELRTPLTAIQGSADLLLLRGHLAPTEHADIEEIAAACRRMSVTIATLLDVARAESGVLDAERSSLRDVIAEVVHDARSAAPATDVAVRVPNVRLLAPHALAVRALAPVVANALDHATTQVEITAEARPGFVDVLVADDGAGVHTQAGEEIFEPGVTSGPGSGLGLAIARRVARSLGGDVSLLDGEGGRPGARFAVSLPVV